MLEHILSFLKRVIPAPLFSFLERPYHYSLALLGAILYGFPSRKLIVIGVTGTKGKTTTVELVNALLEEAGYTTALAGTLRFKIGSESKDNLFKMTLPGRFFIQRFLSEAVKKGATHAVIEISSEAVKQFRHRFLYLDALVFTNLAPEHIESHGSYENYIKAKLEIGKRLAKSGKTRKILVVNADDKEASRFEALGDLEIHRYRLKDATPYFLSPKGVTFRFGKEELRSTLIGEFNIYNMLGALTLGKALGITTEALRSAVEKFRGVRGRVERIDAGQNFDVVVDYAHTPDSLEALYRAFGTQQKICVLGSTGGGRDTWKRPAMGKIADNHCTEIILTNDDPYEEDPLKIVEMMAEGMKKTPRIIIDRREAIRTALSLAKKGDAVLITGKGSDPYLMEAGGKKTPWSDVNVVREELGPFLTNTSA